MTDLTDAVIQLTRYAQHLPNCAWMDAYESPTGPPLPCNCGLDTIRRRLHRLTRQAQEAAASGERQPAAPAGR